MRAMLLSLLLCANLSYADTPSSGPSSRKIVTATTLTLADAMLFAENSEALEPGTAAALDILAKVIKDQESATFEVSGHADPITEKKRAKQLATKRAKAARAYLITQGVDPRRVRAKGYADTQPLNKGATPAESNLNRRVEVRIMKTK